MPVTMWLNQVLGFLKGTSVPKITDAVRAEARKNPGGRVYAIDGDRDPNGAVPPTAIRAAWAVDANGEITGDFISNPNYRKTNR